MDMKDLNNRFAYHQPTSDAVVENHAMVRENCLSLAYIFNNILPEGREKSLAITKLEEAMMWANAAIARNQ